MRPSPVNAQRRLLVCGCYRIYDNRTIHWLWGSLPNRPLRGKTQADGQPYFYNRQNLLLHFSPAGHLPQHDYLLPEWLSGCECFLITVIWRAYQTTKYRDGILPAALLFAGSLFRLHIFALWVTTLDAG